MGVMEIMEKENKNIKLRLMSGLLAITIAGGTYFALKPTNAYATGSKIVTSEPDVKYKKYAGHKIGIFTDENTGITYYTIEVIQGDNASKLSEAIIAVYNKEKQIPEEDLKLFDKPNTKVSRSSFWPAVVYMNVEPGRNFSIIPGDILVFPTEYEKFKSINGEVKASGWYSNYVSKNNIHPPRPVIELPKEVVRRYVQGIYDEAYPEANVYVDDDILRAYLRAHRENGKFEFNRNATFDYDKQFAITDWVPTPDQLDTYLTREEKEKRR